MKCLWCGEPVELYDPGMYQFCDRCLVNLETLCLDLDEAERKLRHIESDIGQLKAHQKGKSRHFRQSGNST